MRTVFLALALASLASAAKTLDIYFIDVEGGQATLLVAPSGQTMLIDAGWPGFSNRDANRIAEAAKHAKVKQIDFMVVTHYHMDHVGGVPQIAAKLPVKTYVTHGPNTETGKGADKLSQEFADAAKGAQQLVVKPGDKIPVKGLDVQVVAANGEHVAGGAANPLCAASRRKGDDPSENARSVGLLISYGKFRFIDLGDLTWNKEVDLACPSNPLGTVDVYLTTHHGLDQSNAPAIVQALHPRVAIMNNGAKKGGSPEAWRTIHDSPGLEDLWQIHFAVAGGKDHNAGEPFIANIDEICEGKSLKLTAESTGAFSVYNSRNKYTKSYAAR